MHFFKQVVSYVVQYLNISFTIAGYKLSFLSILIGFALIGMCWKTVFRLFR